MNYSIVLHDFYSEHQSTCLTDASEFVARCGMNRFIFNMQHKWVWDVRGQDGYDADGACVFIQFNT